ncbi:MAG TPA: LysR substrate-binding domain-containing protein [Steroidobacteraceae bacterium]|jgi:DNA-binding transcriptional LysR family regulator|nr:LysR substrate-binding domain-containing protein [Steroidobacteraceae bacterium]
MRGQLEELTVFVEVARRRSFVRAAQQLEVSVSVVSRAVAALENRLGVRLLQRTTRSVGLTDAGTAYFSRCEALLAELSAADLEAGAQTAELRGRLRVSMATGLGMTHLVPALPEFLSRHPGLTLDLHVSNRFVDLIDERFDLAIRVGSLSDSRLVARRLAPNRRLLAVSSAYRSRHGLPEHPDDLKNHACLVLDIGEHPERWDLCRRNVSVGVPVEALLRCNQAPALLEACRQGAGIALLPAFMLKSEFAARRLLHVLPTWTTHEQGIYAIYPDRRLVPAKVTTFVDYVAGCLQHSDF